jgi:hypothetical protein
MAWDAKDGYLLMFGGARYGPSGNITYNDTWAWTGDGWRQLNPQVSPPGRTFPAMAFDPESQNVILFGGGAANSDAPRNDTWAWNGSTWTELRPANAPARLSEAKTVYDPDLHGLVLVSQAWPGNADHLTTWTWTGSNWKQLNPSTNVSRRLGFGLAYVNSIGVVLVGGYVSAGDQRNDVWLYKGGVWSLYQATPPVCGSCVVVDDVARKVLVLFSNGTNETWTWDGSVWVLQHPRHSPAATLYFAAMGSDPARQQVVLFGGKTDSLNGSPVLDQTWTWNGSDWQLR